MNDLPIFAGVIMPAFVVLCAYVAMRVHENWLAKQPGYRPQDRKD